MSMTFLEWKLCEPVIEVLFRKKRQYLVTDQFHISVSPIKDIAFWIVGILAHEWVWGHSG